VRPTLGELLRRALGRDGAGVADLLDALDAAGTPAGRALIGRVLGGDVLLVVVSAERGAIARADARACRSRAEARALLDAYLGTPAAAWAGTHGIADAGGVRVPALATAIDGAQLDDTIAAGLAHLRPDDALTVVLPFLPLDELPAARAAEPPPNPYAMPAILGGTMRPGAAFLDAPATGHEDDEGDADDCEHGREREHGREHGASRTTTAPGTAPSGATGATHPTRTTLTTRATRATRRRDRRRRRGPRDVDEAGLADAFGWTAAAGAPRAAPAAAEPAADEPVDHSLALGRLRARTTAAAERVSTVIATDDGVAEHVADAAPWLAEASEQELRALARAGWAGDAAAEVAVALVDDDPEAFEVVQLARRHEVELVVEIDGRAAAEWLRRHRPETAQRLGALL
jgi:hypothetical protein